MRIVASNVQLSSAHLLAVRQTTTERLQVRVAPAPTGQGSDRYQHGLSRLEHDANKLARLLKRYFEGTQGGQPSARLIQRIQRLTDRVTRDLAAVQGGAADPAAAGASPTDGSAVPADGSAVPANGSTPTTQLDVRYRRRTAYQEVEATSFRASGSVATADGRQIDFTQALDLARAYARQETVSLRATVSVPAGGAPTAPTAGTDGSTRAPAGASPTGATGPTAPTSQQALALAGGVLGYDANGDGTIDPQTELVGRSGNGFAELAGLDQDGNGFIDQGDAAFGKLAIVSGRSDGGITATSLGQQGVGAIYTGSVATPYTYTDPNNQPLGGLARSGIYLNENGTTGIAQQVDVLT
jgi:hypothetical protein